MLKPTPLIPRFRQGGVVLKVIRLVIGIVMTGLGFLGIGFGILAIIDPIGTQMADDHNPFATPPPLSERILLTVVYAASFLIGLWLIFAPRWKAKRQGM